MAKHCDKYGDKDGDGGPNDVNIIHISLSKITQIAGTILYLLAYWMPPDFGMEYSVKKMQTSQQRKSKL